jgi:opacity protein-like surface antigen
MKRASRFYTLLAILLFLAAPALAQQKDTQYRFELFAAGNVPISKDFILGLPQFTPAIEGTHRYSAGARGGVRFGADFKKHWGEDIIYSYGFHATKIENKTSGTEFPFNIWSHQIAFNALWYPGGLDEKKRAFPYLTAGGGGTFFVISPETVHKGMDAGLGEIRSENVFAFNAGGGVRMRLSKHAGIRIDARDYMSRPPRFGMPEKSDDPYALVFPASGVFHQVEASFAFVLYF